MATSIDVTVIRCYVQNFKTLTKTVNFADEFSRQRKELKIITDKGIQNANDIEWFIFEEAHRKKIARDIRAHIQRDIERGREALISFAVK